MTTRKEVIRVNMMKTLLFLLLALVLTGTAVMAGDAERGKALFGDPKLGTTGESCSTCHPDGTKLMKAAGKDEAALAEIINGCLVSAMKGTPLDASSAEARDLISYLKSVTANKAPAKKKKVIVGC